LYVVSVILKGSTRTIERTNLSYVEPHRIIIKGITFLAFNYETNIYIENLNNKIKISELEEKTNYLVDHLNKVFEKLPKFIQKIVEKLFNNKVLSLFSFKHDYDPEE